MRAHSKRFANSAGAHYIAERLECARIPPLSL
jgi:hypothetical protein